MNKRYQRYIDYIVSDLEIPYFNNMKEMYGLIPNEYELVLSKLFNQPVTINGNYVYDNQGYNLYYEDSNHNTWVKYGYDEQGNMNYYEDSDGYLEKWVFDDQGNVIYYENRNGEGHWKKIEYNEQGREVYYEDSYGEIEDNR